MIAIRNESLRSIGGFDDWFPESEGWPVKHLKDLIGVLPSSQWKIGPTSKTLWNKNVMNAYAKCCARGINPFSTPIIIHMASSERFSAMKAST